MSLETVNLQIKDLGTIITGGTPPTKKREYYGDLVPLIKPTDMVLGQRYIGDTEESLSVIGIEKFKKKLVPKNTPCVVTIGTIGKSCLTKELSLVNQAVNCVLVDEPKYDYMYIYYLMQATIYKVKAMDSGTASGRENVSKSAFESIDVRVIKSKDTQQRVGNLLSNYDNLIENNNRRIAILEDIAQSLYREWFVHFRFPSHEKCQFKDSELGQIPEGWEVKSATEVVEFAPKMSLSKEEAKPFVSMPNVSTTSMIIDKIEMREGNSGTKFMNGDTLMARITPCLQNGKTGFVQFLDEENPIGFGSTEFIVMRSKELTPEFVYCLARSDSFRATAINSMAGADGRQRVKNDCFNSYLLAVPPKYYLEKFSLIAEPIFKDVFSLNKKNKNLTKQRDMLLPKLISGKVVI